MAISPVNQYQMTVQTVASQLENEEISTNEKFSLVARTVLAGANIVRGVHEDNLSLREEKKLSDRRIADLEEENNLCKREIVDLKGKNEVSDRRVVDLEEKNRKIEEKNSSLEESVKKLSCSTHEEYKDNCEYRAEMRKKSLTSQVSMAKTGRIGLWTLGVVTMPILVGSGLVVAAELGVKPEIQKMEKEIWVLENLPESTKNADIKQKAYAIINDYLKKIKDLDHEIQTIYKTIKHLESESYHWKCNDFDELAAENDEKIMHLYEKTEELTASKQSALEKRSTDVEALKNEIQEKFYT